MKTSTLGILLGGAVCLYTLILYAADPRVRGTSVQPSLDQNSNVTVSNVTSKGFLLLSGQTNRLTVASGSLTFAGTITVAGTTNQVTFGATNTEPSSAEAPTKWISVRVSGETNIYRLPLYE